MGEEEKLKIKDIVFCAITAAVLLAISFIIMPMVVAVPVPGFRVLGPAFFFGVLLVIAYVKVGKPWTTTLVSLFVGIVLLMMSVVMFLNFLVAGVLTDLLAIYVFRNGYTSPRIRPVLAGFYISVQGFLGIIFTLLVFRGEVSDLFFENPLLGTVIILLAFVLGFLGGMAGNKIAQELEKAGIIKS